tara:strand:- start:106 stop:762 length:657 start_codon:yes stop_codon:yes gene_type:complete
MKKILGIVVLGFLLVIFNKVIFSQIIIFSISKWAEREIFVSNIDINYSKREIVFNLIEIRNIDKFYYKNIFEADKIKIQYNFKSIFTDLVKIDYLIFSNSRFFLEFDNQINENIIADDNIEVVKKFDSNYIAATYPIKKRDKNFLILETELKNSKVFIKTSSSPKKIKINLSDMNFYKVANKREFQHYKEVFKIILNDIFFRVPDQNLKNLIKKTYKI